jgi:hypothetical protein
VLALSQVVLLACVICLHMCCSCNVGNTISGVRDLLKEGNYSPFRNYVKSQKVLSTMTKV